MDAQKPNLFDQVTIESMRISGALVGVADQLADELGMTNARWQTLGTLARAEEPLTVSEIARRMRLKRQSVQRVINDLERQSLIHFIDNPQHPLWKRVELQPAGSKVLTQLEQKRQSWIENLLELPTGSELELALLTLRKIDRAITRSSANQEAASCT